MAEPKRKSSQLGEKPALMFPPTFYLRDHPAPTWAGSSLRLPVFPPPTLQLGRVGPPCAGGDAPIG